MWKEIRRHLNHSLSNAGRALHLNQNVSHWKIRHHLEPKPSVISLSSHPSYAASTFTKHELNQPQLPSHNPHMHLVPSPTHASYLFNQNLRLSSVGVYLYNQPRFLSD